ncbi:MAG: D-alanyl-D-alanine carboxypeptidase/D-alanyl-D-alanine-endopeptidase [Actinobacteria bacterium RBG_16_67_10]|nr:MAG: D-alanyl-D-alanine carboxypeptidase/D-alanyl-D-alanine-endopeptidase [Actinobacteria bacterium RBG_16_67_10]
MSGLRSGAFAAVAAVALITATSSTEAAAPELKDALGQALASPDIDPARTSALAVDLDTGMAVFRANADRPLLPASAEKLAVSFAALRLLGPGYRFRTEVVGAGSFDGRVWDGDLALVGYGDPTLASKDIEALAGDVAAWGIRRVTGRVLGDEGHFDARRDAPGWKPSYLDVESRPLSALSVAEVDLRGANSSAATSASAFTAALERRGIAVAGVPRAGSAPEDGFPLALDLSDPLVSIVRHMNRESDNFVAEIVLKELGASIARHGSTTAGARVVRSELVAAGVPMAGVRIEDGSGLSSGDRLTARALVSILRAGARDVSIRDAFVTSLSVAGISGTLEKRLARRPTRGRVIAKTGTTNAASALAGFIRRRYVFAILQNGSPVPYWSARAAQDRFVTVLARS